MMIKTKTCSKCFVKKDRTEFQPIRANKDGLRGWCRPCFNEWQKRHRENRKTSINAWQRSWRKKNRRRLIADQRRRYVRNRDKNIKQIKKYKNDHPWQKTMLRINSRCENPKCKSYPQYGGKGIQCEITTAELKKLWLRDGASKMKRPSIDRIDPLGNYTFTNCRYVELSENIIRSNKRGSK